MDSNVWLFHFPSLQSFGRNAKKFYKKRPQSNAGADGSVPKRSKHTPTSAEAKPKAAPKAGKPKKGTK